MQVNKFTFKKVLISKHKFWSYKNVLAYIVGNEEKIIARIEVNSTFTAKIDYESRIYNVRALTRLFAINKLEVFSSENVKIGEIDYWRWNGKPSISIHDTHGNETWEFDKNIPPLFSNRKNIYSTFLKDGNSKIFYEIEKGKFFKGGNGNDCLREVNGIVHFPGRFGLIAVLGIYINELLIFEEMTK